MLTNPETKETPAKKRGKKKLHLKIDRTSCDISIIASTLIAMARNEELDGDTLSHSAEFLGREIRRRARKINAIASYLHGRDLQKERNGAS